MTNENNLNIENDKNYIETIYSIIEENSSYENEVLDDSFEENYKEEKIEEKKTNKIKKNENN